MVRGSKVFVSFLLLVPARNTSSFREGEGDINARLTAHTANPAFVLIIGGSQTQQLHSDQVFLILRVI